MPCLSASCLPERTWWRQWNARVECWWMVTPYRTGMQACFSALGVHLAQRFEQAMRSQGLRYPQGQPPKFAEPGCEWIGDGRTQLELPDFPSLGGGLTFSLPPIPRLLPSWQHLQSLAPATGFEHDVFADRNLDSATTTKQEASGSAEASSRSQHAMYMSSAGAGAGMGALIGAAFVTIIVRRRHGHVSTNNVKGGRMRIRIQI